ncbi:MAG: alpha/beta hydrolase-fold protein [Pseudomonadota bacterium]
MVAASGGASGPTGGASATGGGGGAPASTGGSAGVPGPSAGGGGTGGGAAASGGSAGVPGPAASGGNTGGGPMSSGGSAGVAGAAGVAGSAGVAGAAGAAPAPGTDGDGDFVIAPPYPGRVQPTNVPHSTMFQFTLPSGPIYGGGTRPITVYIPKQYQDGDDAPFTIVTDGNAPASGLPEIVTAAENHYEDSNAATRIPPQVFVFVPPGSNRSGEYDTVSDAFSRFINTEVLPLVESNADIKAAYPHFKLTTDPDGRAAYGCSSGSPAAMGLAWFGDFHRVVSYSGTFVALQATADHPLGAWEYPSMILAAPLKPLRIFLEVAENDNGSTTAETGHRNWVIGNRNLAAALKMRGYHYRFLFAMGAGHCETGVKSKTYSETMAWVWRGYVPAP